MTKTATKPKATGFAAVTSEHLVPINNGFGSWDGFLFGEFDEVGQKCLNLAAHLTLDEALKRANLDYNVGRYQATADIGNGQHIIVPDKFVTVREDTHEALGVVGAGYEVFPYRDAFAPAAALDTASNGEGGFIGAAELDGGKRAACIYALPPLSLGRDEEVIPIVLVWSSQDGSKAIELTFVPVRVACFNGNLWHEKGQSAVYRVKHTRTAEARLEVATDGLAQGSEFFAQWAEEAKGLLKARINLKAARALIESVFEPVEGKGDKAKTIAEKNVDAVLARYQNAPDAQNIKGTKYGVLQAFAAYVDYDHRTRLVTSGTDDEGQKENELRFLRSVNAHPIKDRARAALLAA
jgi:phage/plasmid-like protein (TIGR03299 family)